MSIVFIAVQCFQCSTMQVKQQRKSGNKWTCVVCNEKQSIRKVYARGYQANHVRGFVQEFNATRSDGGEWISNRSEGGEGSGGEEAIGGGERRRKRMDWTEYLDPKLEHDDDDDDDDGVNVNAAKCQKTAIQKGPSKWSKYIEQEKEEDEEEQTTFIGNGNYESLDSKECLNVDHLVEEEVHPDFI